MTSSASSVASTTLPVPAARRLPWGLIVFGLGLSTGLAMMLVGLRVDAADDPYLYGFIGQSLANGDGFPHQPIQRRGPLYPLLIGLLYLIFGVHVWIVHLAQAVMFGATAWLVYDMGRRLFASQRAAIIAGVACALNPLLLRYVATLHCEAFLIFLFTLMVWQTVRFRERPTVLNGVLVGAAAGLTCLVKAVALVYPAVFAALLALELFRANRQRALAAIPWVPLALMFVSMAAVISPWTIRNYKVLGHFVPVSTGTSDAVLRSFIFSRTEFITLREPPYTGAENDSNDLFKALAKEAGTEWQKDEWETEQILNKAAKKKVLAEPGAFVRKTVVGVFTFWYQMTSLKNSLVVGVSALFAWVFAIIGWRRARGEGRKVWMVLAPALYLNILLALLLALGRYSAPVVPGVLVVAGYGVDTLLSRFGIGRSGAAALRNRQPQPSAPGAGA